MSKESLSTAILISFFVFAQANGQPASESDAENQNLQELIVQKEVAFDEGQIKGDCPDSTLVTVLTVSGIPSEPVYDMTIDGSVSVSTPPRTKWGYISQYKHLDTNTTRRCFVKKGLRTDNDGKGATRGDCKILGAQGDYEITAVVQLLEGEVVPNGGELCVKLEKR